MQTALYLKNTLREIQEKSNVFKQNNYYIGTKLLHNLETVNKTLAELEQSFDKMMNLFSEQEGMFARNKIYNKEALDQLEKDVKEAGEFLTKIKNSVNDFKTHKKKIDDTSKLGWEEISTFTQREEEVESQQVDCYVYLQLHSCKFQNTIVPLDVFLAPKGAQGVTLCVWHKVV